jgi:hypothetical protein
MNMMTSRSKVMKVLLWLSGIVLLPLLFTEIALRVLHPLSVNPDVFSNPGVDLQRRLWTYWLAEKPPSELYPPFKVYANIGYSDKARLHEIYLHSKLTPGRTWTASDFLLDGRYPSTYTVTTNSLGFRDPERSRGKPRGVFRILAIGSYQTFGHGVDDRDTYPRQLERALNSGKGRRYEVWNCGRHASTAIMGYALLNEELLAYSPDLLIVEYGAPDHIVISDDTMARVLLTPSRSGGERALKKLVRMGTASFLSNSALVRALSEKIFVRYLKRNNELFSEVINAIVSAARARGVPVIILNQPPPHSYPAPKLSPENAANARFLDVRRLYAENPPSMALARAFYSVPNWTSEWKGGVSREPGLCPLQDEYLSPEQVRPETYS